MQNRITVLWVEDDEPFRFAIARQLEADGFHVIAVPDSLSALAELQNEQRIDLMLADIRMPQGQPHGLALGRMAQMRRPSLPLIFLTAYDDLAEAAEAMPCTVLRKTVELSELTEAIRAQIRH